MSKITAAAAMAVIGMFMVGLFAAPVSAVGPTATAPSWEVGDSWAMGIEVDMGDNMTDTLNGLNPLLISYTGLSIDDLKADCKVSAYVLFEVASETATTYTLSTKMAFKFATDASIDVTGPMPKAGSYNETTYGQPFSPMSTIPEETKTVSVDLVEKLGVVLSADIIVNKDSHAFNEIDWAVRMAMNIEADGKNIPQIDDSVDGTNTISYKDYDLGMDLVFRTNLSMEFTPALDIFQFPFSVGNIWNTNLSKMTVTGEVGGFLDAHGLTTEQKEDIFTEDLYNITGARDFPISFDHLNSADGAMDNSEFGPYEANITSMEMRCLSAVSKTVGGVSYDLFTIQVDGGASMYYSSGFRAFGISVDTTDLPDELPDELSTVVAMMGSQEMEMEPVATSKATAEIAAIETYTASIENQASDKGANSLGDFFFKAPYVGIIMIAICAVVVAGMVYIGMRARKK